MTRRDHARPAAWLTTGPVPVPRPWMQEDPGYDTHRPLSRDDLGDLIRMIPAAIVVLAAFLAVCLFLAAVVPGPTQ